MISALVVLAMLIAMVIVVNDRNHVSRQLQVASVPSVAIDSATTLRRFQSAIRLQTVSATNPARTNPEPFEQFLQLLETDFPSLHRSPVTRRTGAELGAPDKHTLLFTWDGSKATSAPILLMAHYDVVPVEPETRDQWTHPPFSGELDQGFIWGRGSLDAKNAAMAMMEAVTILINNGFQPNRTIYFSLGHDEEIGGARGNRRVAEWLRSEGERLEFVLDEGGCIFSDFPGLDGSVALIGIAEKGFANVQLTANLADGGHASMPPEQTAVEVIAAAIHRLQLHPLPRRFAEANESMLDYLGPEMPWAGRIAVANRWLFRPLIRRKLGATESGNAMLRTTMAPTMIRAGVKENVLPSHATATINVRLLPGDTLSSVIDHMKSIIDDERISIDVGESAREASRTSRTDSAAFDILHRSVKEIYPETIVAPFVLVGGTDSSYYQDIAKDIYRFIPARLNGDDLKRIHGVNERIAQDDYLDLIRFYVQLIKNFRGKGKRQIATLSPHSGLSLLHPNATTTRRASSTPPLAKRTKKQVTDASDPR